MMLLSVIGCGGGSSGGGEGGGLNFRPVWEQRGLTTGTGGGAQATQVTRGSFGPDLPASVQTIRIIFESDAGTECCLAAVTSRLPVDPVSGRKYLVLDALPRGGATVVLAGFPADFAPVDSDMMACPTEPLGVGDPCDVSRVATPSFESAAQRVSIIGGAVTDAGDIPVFAVPFILNPNPGIGGAAPNPVSIAMTIVDAASGIASPSVGLDVVQDGVSAGSAALTLTACDDATSTPCSSGGVLDVSGFQVVRAQQTLTVGAAEVRVQAQNLASPPQSLDFTYPFTVNEAPPMEITPTPIPQTIIVRPGTDITDVAKRAPAGAKLIVAPGVYAPVSLGPGDLRGAIELFADVTGLLTDSPAAAVVINTRGAVPAVELVGQTGVTVDGFTLRGGAGAGLLVQGSVATTIRNCVITDSRGDGIRIESSNVALLFNNLLFGNSESAIRVRATNDLRVINNTMYGNRQFGLLAGDIDAPSSALEVKNNIFNQNTPGGIEVDASTGAYDANFNLNTDGYGASTPAGPNDIVDLSPNNPLFIAPNREDFHLAQGLSGSTSRAIDAGDPATDAVLVDALVERTTQSDGTLDTPPVDLGYHYVPPAPTPTPGT